MTAPRVARGPLRAVLGLLCLYAPYVWLLDEFPPSPTRCDWLRLWPVLPGLWVALLPGVRMRSETLEYVAMGLTTTPWLAIVIMVPWRSARWGWLVWLTVLVLSVANSWVAYQLYWF